MRSIDQISTEEVRGALAQTGIYRIDALPLMENPHQAIYNFSRRLGRVLRQFGQEIIDIRSREGAAAASPFGNGDFPLHVDGIYRKDEVFPHYVVMYCITPDTSGGEHFNVDGIKCIQDLDGKEIARLINTRIQFTHKVPKAPLDETAKQIAVAPANEQPTDLYVGPIYNPENRTLRYSVTLMSRIDPGFAPFSAELERRKTELSDVVPGTLWVIDNKRMLHGRKAFSSNDRHMLRVHVMDADSQ